MKIKTLSVYKWLRRRAKIVFPSLASRVQRLINERNERHHWDERIADVLSCLDNSRLPRVANAGAVINGFQVMHNGVEVEVNGYYGDGITRMLVANRGCHEPQEEIVFQHVVNSLPAHAVIIEAGAYWAFYSIWFAKTVPDAQMYLIEPEEANLDVGKRNFAHNNCKGEFTRGYVGARSGNAADGVQIIALDEFTAERALEHVHMLHADVQSFELEMLDGCKRLLSRQAVDYLFISTHSQDLHRQCIERLVHHGYRILASVDMEETYSLDGILVACSPAVSAPSFDPPSRKKPRSLSA